MLVILAKIFFGTINDVPVVVANKVDETPRLVVSTVREEVGVSYNFAMPHDVSVRVDSFGVNGSVWAENVATVLHARSRVQNWKMDWRYLSYGVHEWSLPAIT